VAGEATPPAGQEERRKGSAMNVPNLPGYDVHLAGPAAAIREARKLRRAIRRAATPAEEARLEARAIRLWQYARARGWSLAERGQP
jgi:hypothetical protein